MTFVRAPRPYARETFPLKLKLDRALRLLCIRQNTKQVLNMMTNFAGNQVRLRKLARLTAKLADAEPRSDRFEEYRFKINLTIGGAIIRPCSRALSRLDTWRVRDASVYNEDRCLIAFALLSEDLIP